MPLRKRLMAALLGFKQNARALSISLLATFLLATSIHIVVLNRKGLWFEFGFTGVESPLESTQNELVDFLVSLWSRSSYLQEDGGLRDDLLNETSRLPRPPHLENCEELVRNYERLDSRSSDGQRPRWTLWKGMGTELENEAPVEDAGEELLLREINLLQGPLPPWIIGGEEDNLPMTRRVQRDLWLHQHPKTCRDPSLKFMLMDFLRDPFFGTGAQLMAIAGMFAAAVNENRVFVLDYYNRADHDGCKGDDRSRWSCYFVPETTKECRERAMELAASEEAVRNGSITMRSSYNDRVQWDTPIPELWGKPWEYQQPTMQVDGELIVKYSEMQRWWWRAQAWRYLVRYPSHYLCKLMNNARHQAFGKAAAEMIVQARPKVLLPLRNETTIEKFVWSSQVHRPWIPRPVLSLHVRQGDKAREMKLFSFEAYMALADNVRARFPQLHRVWLSTEMQNVVEESKEYTEWRFFYTNITRQSGTESMTEYETGLGRMASSNNAFVNLFMSVDCDHFVGALGSTWGTVIDGLRNTGGKAMAGIQSVNPGMYWAAGQTLKFQNKTFSTS